MCSYYYTVYFSVIPFHLLSWKWYNFTKSLVARPYTCETVTSETWDHQYIKMPFYQYKNSNYEVKTASLPSHIYNEIHYLWKDDFCIERVPIETGLFCWYWCPLQLCLRWGGIMDLSCLSVCLSVSFWFKNPLGKTEWLYFTITKRHKTE